MNTSRLLVVAAAGLALGGCATPPEEDPVFIRMNDLDARVQRIERVLTNQSLLELAQRLDALQADVRTIRGEVELLQNETQGGKTQSRNLYGDLEKRLAALETLGGVGGAPAIGATSAPAAGASEQATYDAGMAALRSGNYDKAVATFREVVTNYPTGDLAPNAQFWIGESYYTKGDLESAVTSYRKVLGDWPNSRKAPDAMVKLGFSLSDLKRTGEARSTLEEVVRKYPGTPAAQLAADRLKRLGR
ncbi:MAG TPA: tol-pal system protein YbgF [Steroidobacteraceae bacterium]|nr:tol-pal system protein YbgF [Steroidobacteraceae bacterium]